MPSRDHALERREQAARHELTVVMEQATGCREKHAVTLTKLHAWLGHLNRTGHLLLSDLEHEIDSSEPESVWLWSAIDGTLEASRQIVEIRHRIIARRDDAAEGNTYGDLGLDERLLALQETVSKVMQLIPENADLIPKAYGEG